MELRDKIEANHRELLDRLTEISVAQASAQATAVEAMKNISRRVDEIEEDLKPIKKHTQIVGGLGALLSVSGVGAAIAKWLGKL